LARKQDSGIVVIGLGRFGSALSLELIERGSEVLGIDSHSRIVQKLAGSLTHVVTADSTDIEALRQLGVHEFQRAVVCIGSDLEASIITTSLLADLGIPDIWAKAVSNQHRTILLRVGANHVVRPEHDMGERVAHLVTGRMLDYIEFEDGFALAKTTAPEWATERALGDSRIRSKFGVTVVAIKRRGEEFTYATADTLVQRGDTLIVAGPTPQTEQFAEQV
jgi:trk system potassium uptake protein TrkA